MSSVPFHANGRRSVARHARRGAHLCSHTAAGMASAGGLPGPTSALLACPSCCCCCCACARLSATMLANSRWSRPCWNSCTYVTCHARKHDPPSHYTSAPQSLTQERCAPRTLGAMQQKQKENRPPAGCRRRLAQTPRSAPAPAPGTPPPPPARRPTRKTAQGGATRRRPAARAAAAPAPGGAAVAAAAAAAVAAEEQPAPALERPMPPAAGCR